MTLYFGTDGIRGVANEQLTPDIAMRCGNALARLGAKKVLIGRDTRRSGDMLVCSFASGCMSAGADVVDAGMLPTPGVAYLTKKTGCDFGVVVSASHNPPQYNGIKIFDSDGTKICDEAERQIEEYMASALFCSPQKTGRLKRIDGAGDYCDFLVSCGDRLDGLKVVLDCSNGAVSQTAKKVFESLGAKVTVFFDNTQGDDINVGCGSQCPDFLVGQTVRHNADLGFCFDGDGDRVIAIDEKGHIVDGDRILYIFAHNYKDKGDKYKVVVGTAYTNEGIKQTLKKQGISLLRADVGDKHVGSLMRAKGAWLGGEQSGHIILRDFLPTGDGVLVAVRLALLAKEKRLSQLADVFIYPQTLADVEVKDKMLVVNNERLQNTVFEKSKDLDGRILLRASGTEPKIRILVECRQKEKADLTAKKIAQVVKETEG